MTFPQFAGIEGLITPKPRPFSLHIWSRRGRGAFGRASLLARVAAPGRGDLGQGATALDGAILSGGVVPGDRRLVPLLDEQEVALRVRAGTGVMAASAAP